MYPLSKIRALAMILSAFGLQEYTLSVEILNSLNWSKLNYMQITSLFIVLWASNADAPVIAPLLQESTFPLQHVRWRSCDNHMIFWHYLIVCCPKTVNQSHINKDKNTRDINWQINSFVCALELFNWQFVWRQNSFGSPMRMFPFDKSLFYNPVYRGH